VAYGHNYAVRMQCTDVRGHVSHLVGSQPFSVALTDQTASTVRYSGGFTEAPLANSSGGTVSWSAHKGSKAIFTFTGSSVAFVSTRGPDRGKAKIAIDGNKVGAVKLNSAHLKAGMVVFSTNVREGHHSITVKVAKNGSAGVGRVDVDAFLVMP
jgi:hypothetical protein